MTALYSAGAGIYSIEQLAAGDSVIHRIPPAAKVITTFVYVVLVVSFDRYNLSGLIPYIFYPVVTAALSATPYKPLLKRLAIALPFALFGGLANLFFDSQTAFMILGINVSYGFISFGAILLKTVLSVGAVLILISTTTISDISDSLIRLKVPGVFVLSLMMTYRYVNVLLEEASTMYTAYSLRSPAVKGVKISDMGAFVGQLLIRSIDRAERVYSAMKCRGFKGIYRPAHKPGMGMPYIVCVCAVLLALRFINTSVLLGGLFN